MPCYAIASAMMPLLIISPPLRHAFIIFLIMLRLFCRLMVFFMLCHYFDAAMIDFTRADAKIYMPCCC